MLESPVGNSRLAMDYQIRQCHRANDDVIDDEMLLARHGFPISRNWHSLRSRNDRRDDYLANVAGSSDWAPWVCMQWRLDDPLFC